MRSLLKDVLETRLAHLVCDGTLDLRAVQRQIASGWRGLQIASDWPGLSTAVYGKAPSG